MNTELFQKSNTVLPSGEEALFYYPNVGFGLDQVSFSYKLILIRTMWEDDPDGVPIDYECTTVSLYTMTSNSWRDFEAAELSRICLYYKRSASTCLDGVRYWLADYRDNDRQIILSFELADEVLKESPLPTLPESSVACMGLNDDVLSLLILDRSDSHFEIRTMKEGCWMKETSIGPIINVNEPIGF